MSARLACPSVGLAVMSLGVLVLCMAEGARAEAPPEELAALRIGVASFQEVGSGAEALPDVAEALATALTERGVGRLVGPDALGASVSGEPTSQRVRSLASAAGVDAVVVGRTTRLGNRLSVDVRLRSGRSGGVLRTYVAEVPVAESLAPAIGSLADQVVLGALALTDADAVQVPDSIPEVLTATPAAGSRPPAGSAHLGGAPGAAASAGAAPSGAAGGDTGRRLAPPPFGLGDLDGAPLAIRSDSLEATDRDGMRTLTFRDDVEVQQGDLTLTATYLEATYAGNEKQPQRLVARGDVRLRQGTRSARCNEAVYERERERIVCRGAASMRDGEDEIEGDRIDFDLASRSVSVAGETQMLLHPRASDTELGIGDSHDASAPMSVRAGRLEAEEGAPVHRIVLTGGVEVEQAGVTLRSDRLEIYYEDEARQPERLEASGNVTLVQGERGARCVRAIYRESPRRIDCLQGDLRQSGDTVAGEVITFDLDSDRVHVTGAARLVLAPRSSDEEVVTP